MEIRDLTYNVAKRMYHASVCFAHQGRMVAIPATVRSDRAVHPALLNEMLTHRARRHLDR